MPVQEQNSSIARIVPGINGMPKVLLAGPDGARAEIYLHGAHLTSWVPAGAAERLFLSRASDFNPNAAIRGGVPVIFPQFSSLGSLPKHGFARKLEWEFVNADMQGASAQVEFLLRDTPATRTIWPHSFSARLSVALGAQQLGLTLRVENTGLDPFSFSAALHTYLAVAEIRRTVIEGLQGGHYIDSAKGNLENVQSERDLAFSGEVDRLYSGISGHLVVKEEGRRLEMQAQGFPDVVVWNPWVEKGSALPDLEPEGYRCMLCVEAAAASSPVTLLPSGLWSGTQSLSCV
jgi:glucose-6-phosphate 1-epimerase